MTTAQKNRIQGAISAGVFEVTSTDAFPDGWFEAPDDCVVLPTTGDDFTGKWQNRLQHVKQAEALELTLQILYDVGSNELSGITGAVLGTILGVVKVTTFGWQWTYDLQDECQENFERSTIQEINVDTEAIVSDVQALLLDAATHSSQVSVDDLSDDVDDLTTDVAAVNTKVIAISSAVTALATSLTTETDEIDAALAALALSLTTETDEIDLALAELDAKLVAAQDQSVLLYIEDHLETCRAIVSLLLDDPDGLLTLMVLVVGDLATRAEASGWNIGNARQHMANADSAFANGDAGKGFQSLCAAYGKIVIGA
ncbi:MAG: hypothetical protein IIC89_03695 [Chloroflexi bacterium]|nr:hypothetical protein [Chloroflexota bacterium]